MKDWKFLKGLLLGILLTAVVGVGGYMGVTAYLAGQQTTAEETTPDSIQAKQKIKLLESIIEEEYLEKVDQNTLTENMYAGLISGLGDPYSRYYTKEQYQALNEETEGEYRGIGIVMQQDPDTKLVSIVRCYKGAPGAEAGALPGDIIYKVDDKEASTMELSDVAKYIKSNGKDTVHLTLAREGESDYIQLDVTKEKIEIPSVEYEMLPNQVGYVAIYEFTAVTAQQYESAYSDLEKQGMKKLVIDLRGNPGGLLTAVRDIFNTIAPEKLIVYTEDKNGSKEEYYAQEGTALKVPLAVLVNGNSASASEIFAGAVQDYGIGTLVGTTTFGKGIVQKVTPLTDGSAVKLTISKYYTPNGRNIHGTGIEPDVEVELDDSLKQKVSITKEEDNQLQKALEVLGE